MKIGMTPQELAQTIVSHVSGKEDFVVPASQVHFELGMENQILLGIGEREFNLQKNANGQILDYLAIPRPYANRLQTEVPGLLVDNLNGLMARRPADDRRLLRTLTATVGRGSPAAIPCLTMS